jgi:polysaccharide biosynthesis/export protein
MRLRQLRKAAPGGIGIALSLFLAFSGAGCTSPWWNSFIDPTQVGNFHTTVITEIQDTVSFEDKPSGIPNAVDPTPDDLVATIEDYQLGPGDAFQMSALDYLAKGTQSEFVLSVDDLGYVDVPQLGRIRVEGLSSPEIRDELIRQAKAKGLYSEESEPTITLTMGEQQNRTFNISGAVQVPGSYRIPRSDFRLGEAMNMAGGSNEMLQSLYAGGRIQTIYVIRDEPRPKVVRERPGENPSTANAGQESAQSLPTGPDMAVIDSPAPPVDSVSKPSSRPQQTGPALPSEEIERDLIDAVTPAGAAPRPDRQSAPASPPSTTEAPPPLRPFIFVNDKLIEAPATRQTAQTPPSLPATVQAAPQSQQASRPVDWGELAGEGQQRIIRISAEALRNGDSSANIVIRHRDWIRVVTGPVGSYYIGGHVVQPGQYPCGGEQLTLTQAVIAARGLDPLAWPTRCEIRRRLDRDREQITQWDLARIMGGQDPDVFIRPNDVINIGTHALAPFLYTIRNAFRFSYGFSFSYDRNWAEFDTLAGQYYRSRTEASQRGLLSAFAD